MISAILLTIYLTFFRLSLFLNLRPRLLILLKSMFHRLPVCPIRLRLSRSGKHKYLIFIVTSHLFQIRPPFLLYVIYVVQPSISHDIFLLLAASLRSYHRRPPVICSWWIYCESFRFAFFDTHWLLFQCFSSVSSTYSCLLSDLKFPAGWCCLPLFTRHYYQLCWWPCLHRLPHGLQHRKYPQSFEAQSPYSLQRLF